MEIIRHCSTSTDRYLLDKDRLLVLGEVKDWIPNHIAEARNVLSAIISNQSKETITIDVGDKWTFNTEHGSVECSEDGPYLSLSMLIIIRYIRELDQPLRNLQLDDESSESS